jgi:hypothetical protein
MAPNKRKIRPHLSALPYTKSSSGIRSLAAIITKGFCVSLLALCFIPHQGGAADNTARLSNLSRSLPTNTVTTTLLTIETGPVAATHPKRANFKGEHESRETRRVADWIVNSGDNGDMPFVIVDKIDAKVFVFDADGQLRGAAPALLGLARGDDSAPGIGDKKMSDMRPEERTTPAGRFVASLGYDFDRKDILWVDYDGAVSLHRVVTTNPKERRLKRLATPTPLDNRISYGCINVPAMFYDNVVIPAFTGTDGIVYVLPEIRSISEVFALYYDVGDVEKQAQLKTSTRGQE